MKKLILCLAVYVLAFTAQASPVSVANARNVAVTFLQYNESALVVNQLILRETLYSHEGDALIYAFDIDDHGFILVSADDEMPAVVGYSFGGRFDRSLLPPHLLQWLQAYCEDMEAAMLQRDHDEMLRNDRQAWAGEWKALYNHDDSYYTRKAGKNVEALLTTEWSQGYGYNNYCPMYGNRHAVTGCVATAMAQIIRYHRYPNVGFGHKSYVHDVYGLQSAVFDTSYYDYNLMPSRVTAYTSDAQQHAVSLLCYHCGVAVNMNYESFRHTSGSGAHSQDVPKALCHFGYTNSFYLDKNGLPEGMWDSLLRNNLDRSLPVYYSGSSSEGGHAFVCDGYRTSSHKYHFNFGWGGSGDGFYSLTSVNGYSSGQAAVFNIYPSRLGPMQDTLYVAADGGIGDGSSWANANPNLESAITLKDFYKSGVILVKGGIYYGDTNGPGAAFKLTQGIKIYGGFNGTERTIDDRQDGTPTILSGQGRRQVMYSPILVQTTTLNGLHFTDGYASDGAALYTNSKIIIQSCHFYGNTSESDNLHLNDCLFVGGKVYNNTNGGSAIYASDGIIKNVLVAHNNGSGVSGNGTFLNCDIVCNTHVGVGSAATAIRNCVVWHNGASFNNDNVPSPLFCAIEGYDVSNDTNSNISLVGENRPQQGLGPWFVDPDTTMGISSSLGDWHLSSHSPLRDAGDTIRTQVPSIDLDGDNRFENGRTDIGCYEYGMERIDDISASLLRAYPNPAQSAINIEGIDGRYDIYDMMGRLLLSGQDHGTVAIDLGQWPRGIYLLRHNGSIIKIMKR